MAEPMIGGHQQLMNDITNMFVDFLKTFSDQEHQHLMDEGVAATTQDSKYYQEVQRMRVDENNTLLVDLKDLNMFSPDLAQQVQRNYYRLEPALRKAVQMLVRDVEPGYVLDADGNEREFYVNLHNVSFIDKLRDLKVEKVGCLTAFRGTVTRTSDVRPELFLGAFRCLDCSTIVRGIEQQFKLTYPLICSNATCGNRKNWSLVREDSHFVDWQRVKVQETPEEVPAGSLPRTMDVIMRNQQVEMAKAGDKLMFTGTLVVVPDVGALAMPGQVSVKSGVQGGNGADGFSMKSLGAKELSYRLMFIATSCQAVELRTGMVNIRPDDDPSPEEVLESFPPELQSEVLSMQADPRIYQNLTKSVCPQVYGHDSIKQAVLLMLLGGVHKTTHEGINLRGDINLAIVGDPSCAKSQILKYVANFLPRAVYTSGKASTAAGLTASVVKEPENGEFAIEAGALMLADNGICCIDEFDKMDVKDQVAIHEVMEQQTISIAKAGIQATLNARASILAAANPIGGRYDKSKPLKYNVALPPAILSRFDLLHIMLDDSNEVTDSRIAWHILNVHRFQASAFSEVPYTTEQMQRYIKYARSIKPMLTPQAMNKLVRAYKELRSEDAAPDTQSSYRITVRQLEALVRLSEATARVYCTPTITASHVEEATRLLRGSILTVEQSDVLIEDLMPLPEVRPEDLHDMEGQEQQQQQQQQDQGQAHKRDGDVHMSDAENNPAAANQAEPRVAEAGPAGKAPAAAGTEAGPGPGSAGTAAATAAPGTAGAAEPRAPQPVKITAQKFNYIKNALVTRMLELQREQDQAAAEQQEEGQQGAVNVTQTDLMRWYLESQTRRGALKDDDEALKEMELLFKVINHLTRTNAKTFAVVSKPDRQPGEDETEYLQRVQTDRKLQLHADFAPDF